MVPFPDFMCRLPYPEAENDVCSTYELRRKLPGSLPAVFLSCLITQHWVTSLCLGPATYLQGQSHNESAGLLVQNWVFQDESDRALDQAWDPSKYANEVVPLCLNRSAGGSEYNMINLNYKDSHPRARRGLSFMKDKPFVEDSKQTQGSVVKENEMSACIDNTSLLLKMLWIWSYVLKGEINVGPQISQIMLKNKYI